MSDPLLSRLIAADPVPATPTVEPADRLRGLIEQDPVTVPPSAPTRTASGRGRLFAVLAVLAALLGAGGVLLASGTTGPDLNVAAAAYAATAPRAGVVEAVWVTRVRRGSMRGAVLHEREWLDATGGRRRELDRIVEPGGHIQLSDWVFAPGREEVWGFWGSRAELRRPQLRRLLTRTRPLLEIHGAFGGIELAGLEGVALYRRLYERGVMQLAGRERFGGRLLWKLESRADPREGHTRVIVLVDPHSFLPVAERVIETAEPGRPAIVETTLLVYRPLPGARVPHHLFDLASLHPGAPVEVARAKR